MRLLRRRVLVAIAMGTILVGSRVPGARAETSPADSGLACYYVVFSSRMFTDIQENDAKAAVKAWGEAVVRERRFGAEPIPRVLDGVPALASAIQSGEADVISVTADEFMALGMDAESDSLVVSVVGGQSTEEYLLLVHRDAAIESLDDLRQGAVLMHENPRTRLAPFWLDMILLEDGHPPAGQYFGRLGQVKKVSGVVLPVFFRQADACVVTRHGFETMTELNPQVGTQLLVLATSPPLLPGGALFYRRTGGPLGGVDLLREARNLHRSASGRQLLTLFQTERLDVVSTSALDGVRQLLSSHQRLIARWEAAETRPGSSKAALRSSAAKEPATTSLGGVEQ